MAKPSPAAAPSTGVRMKVVKSVRFAHEGVRVVEYAAGVQDVPADFAAWAIENGYAEVERAKPGGDKPAGDKPKA